MYALFDGVTSFNGDLSSWDVGQVTKMTCMFRGATSFNGDLSSWDVGQVTDMRGMFYGACLLYTSPSPRDQRGSRMPSSA